MDARTLETIAPHVYLAPESFQTEYDGKRPERAAEQYAEGLKVAMEWQTVAIGCNGCWGASKPVDGSGATLTSYERIGYHAETAALLKGFLAGTAEIVVYRYPETGYPFRTVIKPRS